MVWNQRTKQFTVETKDDPLLEIDYKPGTNIVVDFVSLLFGDVDASSMKPILATIATDVKSANGQNKRQILIEEVNLCSTFSTHMNSKYFQPKH